MHMLYFCLLLVNQVGIRTVAGIKYYISGADPGFSYGGHRASLASDFKGGLGGAFIRKICSLVETNTDI